MACQIHARQAEPIAAMRARFPELPEWEFVVDEVSAGVLAIRALHLDRIRLEKTGTENDRDRLIEEAKRYAAEIEALRRKRDEMK